MNILNYQREKKFGIHVHTNLLKFWMKVIALALCQTVFSSENVSNIPFLKSLFPLTITELYTLTVTIYMPSRKCWANIGLIRRKKPIITTFYSISTQNMEWNFWFFFPFSEVLSLPIDFFPSTWNTMLSAPKLIFLGYFLSTVVGGWLWIR